MQRLLNYKMSENQKISDLDNYHCLTQMSRFLLNYLLFYKLLQTKFIKKKLFSQIVIVHPHFFFLFRDVIIHLGVGYFVARFVDYV